MDELVAKIKFYLTEENARNQIIEQGYEQAKKYTMRVVLKGFMNFLEKGGGNGDYVKT